MELGSRRGQAKPLVGRRGGRGLVPEDKQGGRQDLVGRISGSATLQNAIGPEFWESDTLACGKPAAVMGLECSRLGC